MRLDWWNTRGRRVTRSTHHAVLIVDSKTYRHRERERQLASIDPLQLPYVELSG